ncbi:MAG: hypothetical protein ACKO3P_09605, partial [Planctomycetaceae bacterium]
LVDDWLVGGSRRVGGGRTAGRAGDWDEGLKAVHGGAFTRRRRVIHRGCMAVGRSIAPSPEEVRP